MDFDELTFLAFRYCPGRKTYIVSDMVEHLLANLQELHSNPQKMIIAEIESALQKGQAGMQMDAENWERVIDRFKESHREKVNAL